MPRHPGPEPLSVPLPREAIGRPWRNGAVYAIGHRAPDGTIGPPFKIGRVGPGSVVKNRLTSIQTGSHAALDIALIQPVRFSSSAIEALLHIALAKRRMHGEWFDCSIERIQQVLGAALKYERDPIPREIQASPAAKKHVETIIRARENAAMKQWKQALD